MKLTLRKLLRNFTKISQENAEARIQILIKDKITKAWLACAGNSANGKGLLASCCIIPSERWWHQDLGMMKTK